MNPIKFIYKGKLYNPKDPEKKLKQLKITWDDVELVEQNTQKEESEKYQDIKLYYFINPKTGWSISSIHSDINNNDYESCTKEYLEEYWNKNRTV